MDMGTLDIDGGPERGFEPNATPKQGNPVVSLVYVARDETGRTVLVRVTGQDRRLRAVTTGDIIHDLSGSVSALNKPIFRAVGEAMDAEECLPIDGIHTVDGLGLVTVLVDEGPIPSKQLMDVSSRCESDMHGLIGDLRAGTLLTDCQVAGQRGYRATSKARNLISGFRNDGNNGDLARQNG